MPVDKVTASEVREWAKDRMIPMMQAAQELRSMKRQMHLEQLRYNAKSAIENIDNGEHKDVLTAMFSWIDEIMEG